jgi:hypothetical protein
MGEKNSNEKGKKKKGEKKEGKCNGKIIVERRR